MARRQLELKIVSLDRSYGPLPLSALVRLATEGRIAPQDLVRPAGTQQWHRVDEVPALAAALPRRAAGEAAGEGGEAVDRQDAAGGGWMPRRAGRRQTPRKNLSRLPVKEKTTREQIPLRAR